MLGVSQCDVSYSCILMTCHKSRRQPWTSNTYVYDCKYFTLCLPAAWFPLFWQSSTSFQIICKLEKLSESADLRQGSLLLAPFHLHEHPYGFVRNSAFYIFLYCVWRVIWNTPKFNQLCLCITAELSRKFHQNPLRCFWVMLLTDRQTNKQSENITSLTEVITTSISASAATATGTTIFSF